MFLVNEGHRIEIICADLFKRYFSILNTLKEENLNSYENGRYSELVPSFPCSGPASEHRNKTVNEDKVYDDDFCDILNDYSMQEPDLNFKNYLDNYFLENPEVVYPLIVMLSSRGKGLEDIMFSESILQRLKQRTNENLHGQELLPFTKEIMALANSSASTSSN